ncbi:MAG TPA: GxxExxY protein [Spirochaetota bacterium]|nr:GxxExxY protein [Spirochaetota bacterium]
MKEYKLSAQVIQAAHKIYNRMGNGFLEKVYENCLRLECENAGLKAEKQKELDVWYKNEIVGKYFADLIIEKKLLIEIKAVSRTNKLHLAQVIHYLKATGIKSGLLINFGSDNLYVKRVSF